MLNLSDNELDRLSREAASQHDPGDLLGPQSWDRLELHLDKELGKAGPDASRGLRGIRRLPFQYAPVLLLVVGVTYYFVKAKGRKTESSGSPPLTVVKTPQQTGTSSDSSLKNPAYSDNTSTLYPGGDTPSGTTTGTPTAPASSPTGSPTRLEQPSAGPNSTSPAGDRTASGLTNSSHPDRTAHGSGPDNTASGLTGASATGQERTSSGKDRTSNGLANNSGTGHTAAGPDKTASGKDRTASGPNRLSPGLADNSSSHISSGQDRTASNLTVDDSRKYHGNNKTSGKGNRFPGSADTHTAGDQTAIQDQTSRLTTAVSDQRSDPERVYIQHPFSLRSRPRTNGIALRADSALQAYADQARKDQSKNAGPALHINRALGIGFQFAPDFTSINALAGDRPGSTLGLTLDYEILDGLHLGTGFLFSRKNYTARGIDYHTPPDYFRQNGMKPADFVKGTMNMLEIPINVRYDFSRTPGGGTIFFASAGVSSYLFGQEHSNYYYDFFGSEACRDFHYSNTPNGLFASVNLSLGVEAKISNSVHALIAPYMKFPTSDMGFGKVKMNSVGINFAIRFTPVIARSRQHN